MTVTSTPRKAILNGNSSTTAFPWAFKTQLATDIAVIRTTAAGSVTTLVKDSDYTVSLNANQDTSPGGTITYPVTGSPLPTGDSLAVLGNVQYTQDLVIPSAGAFSSLAMNNQLDRIVMQVQQLDAMFDSVLMTANGETLTPLPAVAARANRLLAFDASGNPTTAVAVAGTAAALTLDLVDATNAGKGAGQVGYNSALGYGATTVGSALTAATRAAPRNKLINGAFDVWQRATSFSSGLATATYTADRWVVFAAGASVTVSLNAGNGFTPGTDALILTGAASNTYVDLRQRIPAREVQRFKNGSVTVSARLYNNTGSTIAANSVTFTVSTPTAVDTWAGSTQQLGTTFTHAAIPNASWGYLTVTFSPSGYVDIDKGMDVGLRVTALLAGQAVNWSEIQLETGPVATSFEHTTNAQTLLLCQRFFYRLGGNAGTEDIATGAFISATEFRFVVRHPVRMRGTPAITAAGTLLNFQAIGPATFPASGFTINAASIDSFNGSLTVTSATPGHAGYARCNNIANFFFVNAELI